MENEVDGKRVQIEHISDASHLMRVKSTGDGISSLYLKVYRSFLVDISDDTTEEQKERLLEEKLKTSPGNAFETGRGVNGKGPFKTYVVTPYEIPDSLAKEARTVYGTHIVLD